MKRILLLSIFAGALASAQTPCNGGMAGIYPCSNMDLMARVDFNQMGGGFNTEGSSCWGWTDPLDGKEYAIMGCSTHTAFVDITNPAAPVYKGKVNSTNNVSSWWREMKVYNNYCFIVSEANGHGMQIFDLTRLRNVTIPQTFSVDALYTGFGNCHTISINEATGYAYCFGSNTFGGGVHVVNIQNPESPVLAMGYPQQDYTHDGQVVNYIGPDTQHTGKEIFVGANEFKVIVVDVTNKSNPILLSTFTYPNTSYTHQGWFTPDHKYWILGDEIDELDFGFDSRTLVIDMTNLDAPTLKMQYFGPTEAIDHNGYTKEGEFYLANYTAGLRLIDTEGIAGNVMQEIGFFDTYPQDNSASFQGAWSNYPYFPSGSIIISDIDRGLFVVRKGGALSVGENQSSTFVMSPNPATESVSLSGASVPMDIVEIFDIPGKRIRSYAPRSMETTLDLRGISPGVYLVRINGAESLKLVVR